MVLKFLKQFLLCCVRRTESTQTILTEYEEDGSQGWSSESSRTEIWSNWSDEQKVPEKMDDGDGSHEEDGNQEWSSESSRTELWSNWSAPDKVPDKMDGGDGNQEWSSQSSRTELWSNWSDPQKVPEKMNDGDGSQGWSSEFSRTELWSNWSAQRNVPEKMDVGWLTKDESLTIRSASDEYEILEFLGQGSFGKVEKCLKKGSTEVVAVKISKFTNLDFFNNECLILRTLNSVNPDKFNFVRNLENFMYENRFHMVFELLEKSLWDYMAENDFWPLPMEGIRHVTKQLLIAQDKLKDLHIIHGDLKPKNIMLVNHHLEPFRIKVIDFGLSIQLPTKKYPVNLGTAAYRAPEITLGMEYDEAVDMWSTGCIVAEMLTGEVLYPGHSPYAQIRFVDQVQGPFPDYMLRSNKIAAEYFSCESTDSGSECKWRLKHPVDYYSYKEKEMPTDGRKYRLENLGDLLQVCSFVRRVYAREELERKYCVDMIKEMLDINHEDRIVPDEALKCNFLCHGITCSNSENTECYQ